MQPSDQNYNVPPFPAFPSTSRYVPLGSIEEAYGRVCRSIDGSEAVSLVIGPPGTGKSLLCALVAAQYRQTHDVVVLGETQIEDREAFLRHLLHHMQIERDTIRDEDLQLAVIDRVCRDDAPEGGLLVIVDEAQSLSKEVIESIRMVTNIMKQGVPRVSAVVCGGVKLEDLLIEPSMESFTQRVATRCYLHPMNAAETNDYICETIRHCGADPSATISESAIATVHHACSGVPRLINQLMTQAIDCAAEADQVVITDQIIEAAWAQLQQLPSPMVEQPRIELDSSCVEFGELDESGATDTDAESIDEPSSFEPTAESSSFDDIQFEGSSAQWLEESDESTEDSSQPMIETDRPFEEMELLEASIPQAEESTESDFREESPPETIAWDVEQPAHRPETDDSIFGDFDHEEEISVGNGVEPALPSEPQPTADLEQILHQEIIGINESMHELLQTSDPEATYDAVAPSDDVCHEPATSDEEELADDVIAPADEPFASDETQSTDDAVSDERDEPSSLLWVGEEVTDVDEDDETVARDDSDILVIEDEVQIQRIDAAKQYDSLDQTISVDFQAMLSRMRSNS